MLDTAKIAAQMFINENNLKDRNVWFLETMQLLRGVEDLESVASEYSQIRSGFKTIVEIVSSIELEERQKNELEKKIQDKFNDKVLIFVYEVDSEVEKGLFITVGDLAIDI